MDTPSERCVRRATLQDLPFVLEAQASMPHDLDSATPEEIARALMTEQTEAYILIADGRYRAILAVQADGNGNALLGGFYRTPDSPVMGLKRDAQALLDVVLPQMRLRSVTRLYGRISLKNRRYKKLVRFYQQMVGLKPESVNLSARLE